MFLASVIAVGLLILVGNFFFNPIRELSAAEALRPTFINVDLVALDAVLEEGNAGVSGKEFLAQQSEYLQMDNGIESALSEQTRFGGEEDQPNTLIAGTNVPPFVDEECNYPVQKALDIERVLSKAEDPQNSIWLKEYCGYRAQMWTKQCYVPNDYLYYGDLCKNLSTSQ